MGTTSKKGAVLDFEGLFPPFGEIRADDVVPGMTSLLATADQRLQDLEAKVDKIGTLRFPDLAHDFEFIEERLDRAWSAVSHLKSVCDSDELRKAVEEVQPEYVKFCLKAAQSKTMFKAWERVASAPDLSPSQVRIVESEILDAKLSGIALEGEKKDRFNEIQTRLAKLSTDFGNNVLDATKAFTKKLTNIEQVKGLPESARKLAAQTAKTKGDAEATAEAGPWVLTLDIPSYLPAMQHAEDRALRKEMYDAYLTRASEYTPKKDGKSCDNEPLIREILQLKLEKAKMLGYESHAEVSMAKKMATLPDALKMIKDLLGSSKDKGLKELQELQQFAEESFGWPKGEGLRQWDVPFYAERLKEARYSFKQEELKPYFSLPKVQAGLFTLAKRLFDVDIAELDPKAKQVSTWHPDVKLFEVRQDGKTVAYFYMDPYSRPETKKGGAWMSDVCGRTHNPLLAGDDGVRLPVAHVVCNQSPPVGDEPSLMTFGEVETLFHEFGHSLQHMLTNELEGKCSGIRLVEWDAVEQPSQFMENWCYDKQTMDAIALHYKTGETIPAELFQKVVDSRTFRAASMMLRQLHFSWADLRLHSEYDPTDATRSIFDLDREVGAETDVLPVLEHDRFLCSFSHIFAGGYAAGYFSYKWAEVLSADCFAAFEEAGLSDDTKVKEVGRRFRETVLGMGGGIAPAEVFRRFRGRDPKPDALLRHNGLS